MLPWPLLLPDSQIPSLNQYLQPLYNVTFSILWMPLLFFPYLLLILHFSDLTRIKIYGSLQHYIVPYFFFLTNLSDCIHHSYPPCTLLKCFPLSHIIPSQLGKSPFSLNLTSYSTPAPQQYVIGGNHTNYAYWFHFKFMTQPKQALQCCSIDIH